MNIYDNTPDEGIIEAILAYEEDKAEADKKSKIAKAALLERRNAEIAKTLAEKKEPFGSVSTEIGGKKITFTTPKKVEWDQAGLATVHAQIIADGADAFEYMQTEYKIREDAYKNWPSNLKEYFEPYRTVTPGNIAIKIEEINEK